MARKEDYWTPEQEEYLAGHWGTASMPTLVRFLKKSRNAIVLKKNRMGLGAFLESGGYVSLNILLTALSGGAQSQGYKLISWVENRGLPIHTKRVDKNKFQVVKIDEFWKWAEKHRSFIDFSKLEENVLGKEPAWVKEQRKLDAIENRMHKVTPWTAEEDAMLMSMLRQYSYTYSDIARRLRRSEGAVVRRISHLGCKERPLREPPHSPWHDWQRKILPELIMKGMGYGMLAGKLKKTEKAIRGYVSRTYGTEVLDKVRRRIEDD